MWHMLAYAGATLDATAGDVQLPGVSEQLFQLNNNDFRMPEDYNVIWARAGLVSGLRARINTPYLRNRGFPQIYPLDTAIVIPSNGGIADFRNFPVLLRQDEDVRIEVTNSVAGNAVVFLGITNESLDQSWPVGDVRWVRFTTTNTLTLLTWSAPSTITFQDRLESGLYEIYGCAIQSADCIAARLIFNDQYLRPGCFTQAAVGDQPSRIFQQPMGVWGRFRNTVPPQLEALGSVAGAENMVGWMQCKKIAA